MLEADFLNLNPQDKVIDITESPPSQFEPCVSAHGYSDARIFFIGGYPLRDDLAQGLSLVGFAESKLNSLLRNVGLNIKQCYRSTFIKQKLEFSGTNTKKLRKAIAKVDAAKYEEILFTEIAEVNPTVIVPLDDIALATVFPHISGMKKPARRKHWIYCYRGSILPLREDWQLRINQKYHRQDYCRVIPTIGPQILVGDDSANVIAQIDFNRIKANIENRSQIREIGLCWVAKTAEQFKLFLERQYAKKPTKLYFDVETYGGLLTCISFCFDGNESCTVPLLDPNISSGERVLLYRLIAIILSDPATQKGNQNIKYDLIILERHGFVVNNVVNDTMLKSGLIYPELPKALDFLTSIYTPIPYYKDEGKEFNPRLHTRDRLYLYCAKDSLAAALVDKAQEDELLETNQHDLYYNNIAPLILIYKDIDNNGILVDPQIKAKLNKKYKDLYQINLAILQGLVGSVDYNPNSSQQAGKLIYEELGFPKRTKVNPETGMLNYRTDKETLDDLLVNYGNKTKSGTLGRTIIIRQITARKLAKVLEYINTPLHPDGRFRGSSNLAGTESGRSSFSKTIDEALRFINDKKSDNSTVRLGRSLQTISKHGFTLDEDVFDDIEDIEIASDIRSMFVPSHGYVFIEVDGSQAESRVVAVLAEDFELLESFDKKPKIHAKTAAFIFGIDPTTITKDQPRVPIIGMAFYDIGKRAMHAGSYDMQAGRLSQMTHISYGECKRIMEKFHERYPKIRGIFHENVRNIVKRERILVTPFGRRRSFFGRLSDSFYKEAISYIPQSTVTDHTKFTLPLILKDVPAARILAEQHDGIFSEVKKDDVDEYLESSRRHYQRPINFNRCSLSSDFNLCIPAEISISETNWQELKEVK